MIAIGKTIPLSIYLPFSMSENEPFFQHKQPKFSKSANIFFFHLNLYGVGYQKKQNFMLILNSLKRAQKMSGEKL